MKSSRNIISAVVLLLFVNSFAFSQNAKKNYKTGVGFIESKNYKDAIDQFSKALELDAQYIDAYVARAEAYEKMFKFRDAIKDYVRAATFDAKDETYMYNAARLYNVIGESQKAIEHADKALTIDRKHLETMNEKAAALIALGKYKNALDLADNSINTKKTSMGYYYHGVASAGLKDFAKAEYDFGRSVYYDDKNTAAYVEFANTLTVLNKFNEALSRCDKALEFDKKNTKVLVAKAEVYKKMKDYPKAIDNLSQAIIISKPNEKNDLFYTRGTYYQEFGQHDAAINDFTEVITKDGKNVDAIFARGFSYEKTFKYESAIADYTKLTKVSSQSVKAANMLKEANKRLYELNREEEAPKVALTEPLSDGDEVKIPKDWKTVEFKGQVTDKSKIESISVPGQMVAFDKEALNPEFSFNLNIEGMETFNVTVMDVYKNKTSIDYKIVETEINAPRIKLIAPYASDDGEIYLATNDNSLYIEGQIKDESLVKSVFVDGATASFLVDQFNPTFSATINIANKDAITISATDAYGNETVKKFKLNREGANLSADNPMGKTWVIFIENSKYSSFASLDGPSKDVTVMKTALARYKIHNVIRKRDMDKSDFERFFAIELRDLVRSNRVNSLLIWYAGHGKFINETGYWIPVDAKRDDEFTYFNINSLKASMQSYSKYITHTLVVTDACESGPSFYQAMRSTPKERVCSDWQATKFKSSQVFSSAGYELASDNSQFTKTFANSLLNNPNACIPIEKIVSKVTVAVSKNNSQKPKFGKIAGFEDENGTFFFMKK